MPSEPPPSSPHPSQPGESFGARLSPGDVFADFVIEQQIGRGEMGIVYRVKRRTLDRTEALKVIAPKYAADPNYHARFKREATHAALAHHPHVVTVYDANEIDGRLYIAMQFVDGEDLRKRIAAGPLLPPSAAEITRQVGSALDAAHRVGLVHRDVKPANILLAAHGAGDHAYLTDFGVSRRITTDDDLTQPGMFVGAADYAAPEQHRGEPVDARTDVYSLGCVLFEMLTGQKPFRRDSSTAVAMAHCLDPPPAPRSLNPRLGEAFDRVLLKALAKQPDDRYQTALELGDAAVAAAAGADWDDIEESRDEAATEPPRTDETQILPHPERRSPGSEDATQILPGGERQPSPKPAAPRPPARPARRDAPPRRSRFRWVAAVVVALPIVAAIAVLALTRTSGGKSATVAANTNIRSSPEVPADNPQANVVGSFSSSKRVKVSCWTAGSGAPDGWARLQSPDAGRYVSADLLTPVIRTPVC
jgi:serine/threonine protein kinase